MSEGNSERVGPLLNPPHLGELIRESMDETGWNVTETATRLGCKRWNPVAPVERSGGSIRGHGTGARKHRVGDSRALDADAGELRLGTRATEVGGRGRLIAMREIPEGRGKVRVLEIPAIRDRVVQGAIKLIVEPIFRRRFSSGVLWLPTAEFGWNLSWCGVGNAVQIAGARCRPIADLAEARYKPS